MESIIAEYSSNWSYFNILIGTDVPFIFKDDKLLYLNNFISEEGIRLKGLKEGVWISPDENYTILSFYLNDKLNGKTLYESKDYGNVKKINYLNGKKHGKEISWGNQQKIYEIDWLGGKKNGKEIWWFENGQKSKEINYKNDKKHGKEIGWYENGQKECEIDYVNGKKRGKEIWWYENGQKQEETDLPYGVGIGKSIFCRENGQKVYEVDYSKM